MAKFCNGSGVQSVLTDIIAHTEKELYIISPYLKIPVQMKKYLKIIDKKNIPITIIYRTGSSLDEDDLNFFKELNHLELRHCDDLHTKCYINEKEGLITSMNLHEYSQTHNWEMGIKFSKQIDFDIYTDVEKEINDILSLSPLHTLKQQSLQKTVYKPKEAPKKGKLDKILDSVFGEAAFCIRCGEPMDKYNLEKPLCNKCYSSWAQYKKKDFKEKYCHACGEEKPNISYEKPVCRDCFNRMYK